MPSWLPTLIIILVASWGAIAQVIQSIAKKAKEKKRQDEAALRATRQLDLKIGSPDSSLPSFEMRSGLSKEEQAHTFAHHQQHAKPAPQQPSHPAQRPAAASRESDLAARRRAQIEQLKQRRVVAFDPRTGSIQIRAAGATGSPSQTRPTPPQRSKSVVAKHMRPASVQPFRAAHQAPPPPPTAAPRRQARPAAPQKPAARAPSVPTPARVAASRDAYAIPSAAAGAGSPGVRATTADSGSNLAALRSLLSDPQSIRNAIVLREVLDPPVALRQSPEPGYLAG